MREPLRAGSRLAFLHAIYRYEIQEDPSIKAAGMIPFDGFMDMMGRRYEQAITAFRRALTDSGPNGGDLHAAPRRLTIRLPSRRLPTRSGGRPCNCQGTRWHVPGWRHRRTSPADHSRLLEDASRTHGLYPILDRGRMPGRLDLSHIAWSDIFFLGMDYPEGPGS